MPEPIHVIGVHAVPVVEPEAGRTTICRTSRAYTWDCSCGAAGPDDRPTTITVARQAAIGHQREAAQGGGARV